jgi:hypothetical protein
MFNAKRTRRIYNGDKDSLPNDSSFNLFVVMAAALFAEYLLKGDISDKAIIGAYIALLLLF